MTTLHELAMKHLHEDGTVAVVIGNGPSTVLTLDMLRAAHVKMHDHEIPVVVIGGVQAGRQTGKSQMMADLIEITAKAFNDEHIWMHIGKMEIFPQGMAMERRFHMVETESSYYEPDPHEPGQQHAKMKRGKQKRKFDSPFNIGKR